jgi:hypothetical protein
MKLPRMPRFERSTVFVILGAVILAIAYWGLVNYARDYYDSATSSASTFNDRAEGLSVWYRYLGELGLRPSTLQTFETLPANATIISAGPYVNPPTKAEARRLSRWVQAGGRLVLVGIEAGPMLPGTDSSAGGSEGDTSTVAASLPSIYAAGVKTVAPGPERLLPTGDAWVSTFGDPSGKVLISRTLGRGEVVWLAGAHPVSNAGIGERDNGRLAVLLAAPDSRAIYFDEYHQGFVNEASVWDRLSTGGQWAVVLSLLGVAVLVTARARRLGPVIRVPEEPEARTGAYIGSLAELYRKAGARAEGLEALEEGLRRALVRRHGTIEIARMRRPDAAALLSESAAVRARGNVGRDEFVATARRLSRARREVEA